VKINKENFDVFIKIDPFDSLLPYKPGSSFFGNTFDVNKILVGTEKNPNKTIEDSSSRLKQRQKSYKKYNNNISSLYDKFKSLPDNFEFPLLTEENEIEEILIDEKALEFLKFLNKREVKINSEDILSYDLGFTETLSLFNGFKSETIEEEIDDFINPTNISNTTINNQNVLNQTTIEKNSTNKINNIVKTQVEKTWEKIIESKVESKKSDVINNFFTSNEFKNTVDTTINNSSSLQQKIDNIVNQKTENNQINQQTILINQIQQTVVEATKTIEKNIESKLQTVVKEVHNQQVFDKNEILTELRRTIQREKEENKSLQKQNIQSVDKTLKDFLRS
jgi:uncharacterized coiled-coil protein SlyX